MGLSATDEKAHQAEDSEECHARLGDRSDIEGEVVEIGLRETVVISSAGIVDVGVHGPGDVSEVRIDVIGKGQAGYDSFLHVAIVKTLDDKVPGVGEGIDQDPNAIEAHRIEGKRCFLPCRSIEVGDVVLVGPADLSGRKGIGAAERHLKAAEVSIVEGGHDQSSVVAGLADRDAGIEMNVNLVAPYSIWCGTTEVETIDGVGVLSSIRAFPGIRERVSLCSQGKELASDIKSDWLVCTRDLTGAVSDQIRCIAARSAVENVPLTSSSIVILEESGVVWDVTVGRRTITCIVGDDVRAEIAWDGCVRACYIL